MKNFTRSALIVLASTFAFSTLSRAEGALDTPARAALVKSKMEQAIFSLEGVNGVGITGCNPITGARFVPGKNFVHCISVYTATQESYDVVSKLYPQGINVKGVYIVVEQIGQIVAQPRVTGSN